MEMPIGLDGYRKQFFECCQSCTFSLRFNETDVNCAYPLKVSDKGQRAEYAIDPLAICSKFMRSQDCYSPCDHDKCYSPIVLTSSPPQQDWVCRKCGERGRDRMSGQDSNEYYRLTGKSKS